MLTLVAGMFARFGNHLGLLTRVFLNMVSRFEEKLLEVSFVFDRAINYSCKSGMQCSLNFRDA